MFCHALPVHRSQIGSPAFDTISNIPGLKTCYLTKVPQGFIFSTQNKNIMSAIHTPAIYQKSEEQDHQIIKVHPDIPFPFKVHLDDVLTSAHEVSRHADINHIFNQLSAANPLSSAPRTIFQNKAIGSLLGRMIMGPEAIQIKAYMLSLLNSGTPTAPHSPYDQRLAIPPHFAESLMLKNKNGVLRVTPCQNGIIGYRTQPCGARVFVFLANSSDFFQHTLNTQQDSDLQVYKMDYEGTFPERPRFTLVNTPEECLNHLNVPVNATVQRIINHIELGFRRSGMEALGLQNFSLLADASKDLPGINDYTITPDDLARGAELSHELFGE